MQRNLEVIGATPATDVQPVSGIGRLLLEHEVQVALALLQSTGDNLRLRSLVPAIRLFEDYQVAALDELPLRPEAFMPRGVRTLPAEIKTSQHLLAAMRDSKRFPDMSFRPATVALIDYRSKLVDERRGIFRAWLVVGDKPAPFFSKKYLFDGEIAATNQIRRHGGQVHEQANDSLEGPEHWVPMFEMVAPEAAVNKVAAHAFKLATKGGNTVRFSEIGEVPSMIKTEHI
jgi:hypothetical protein